MAAGRDLNLVPVTDLGPQPGYVTPLTDGDNLFVREAGQYSMRDYVINGLPIYILQTIA